MYIGLASKSLQRRVEDYYNTKLGARSPHAGGWPLKTLSDLDALWVYWAHCSNVDDAERALLEAFVAGLSARSRRRLYDPDRPMPFANLEFPRGNRKRHGITGAREPREPVPHYASSKPGPPTGAPSAPPRELSRHHAEQLRGRLTALAAAPGSGNEGHAPTIPPGA